MKLYKLTLPALFVLGACGTSSSTVPPAQEAKVTQKVTTVCAMYERALTETKAALLPAPIDIVIGCPGRTSLKSQRSRLERVAAVREATAAPVPATAGETDYGTRLFQRMISRGVPVEVATRMTTTREFARALAARI